MDRCFGAGFQARNRALHITYMNLRGVSGAPMLSDCKEYWEHHHDLSRCFTDLRPFVEILSSKDANDFYNFILDRTMEIIPRSSSDKVCGTVEFDTR